MHLIAKLFTSKLDSKGARRKMIGLTLLMIGLCAFTTMAMNPMEDPNLVEGDMIMTEDQKREYYSGGANYQIPLAATKVNLWPRLIPYDVQVNISTSSKAMRAIKDAIADYEKYTCLRFKRRTDEAGYLFFWRGGGCSSPVGFRNRPNRISLGSGCWSKGTVIHEIAHSLGFYHEQSRPDRDNHVKILWDNIYKNLQYNFKKRPTSSIDSMGVPYDFNSVMHYGPTAFGIKGQMTIQTLDPSKQGRIGNRNGFSGYDILQMNLLYKCPVACRDTFCGCSEWKTFGLCSDQKYQNFSSKFCGRTCGTCKVPTTVPTVTTQKATTPFVCKNSNSKCGEWASYGFCTDSRYVTYMKKNCPLACGFCGGATTPIPRTTRADCKDSDNRCPYWKAQGFCTNSRYEKWMKDNCKISCDTCPGPSTVAPTTSAVTGNCGQPDVQQGRVIAGTDAKKGAWPWQILMFYNGKTSCGGSLVSPKWVVTAAHCVHGRDSILDAFRIRVGEHNFSSSTDGPHKDIKVSKIVVHPKYSRSSLNNDVALMELETPVKFDKYVKPVCLPNQDQHVPVGTQCFITGWGKIKHPGSMHHTLQQAKMPVVSKTDCNSLNTKNIGVKITDQMVCAGHGGATDVSGCHGDSGGPFVCQTGANGRWVLHGAVSWGSATCSANVGYTVFARLAQFRSWIDQEMTRN